MPGEILVTKLWHLWWTQVKNRSIIKILQTLTSLSYAWDLFTVLGIYLQWSCSSDKSCEQTLSKQAPNSCLSRQRSAKSRCSCWGKNTDVMTPEGKRVVWTCSTTIGCTRTIKDWIKRLKIRHMHTTYTCPIPNVHMLPVVPMTIPWPQPCHESYRWQ